jgi:5-methylcytosine-specific restriction endonuclease McrA
MGRFADPDLRFYLFDRQGGRCAICGQPLGDDFQIDHIIPWAEGGPTNTNNLQAICPKCHKTKTRLSPAKARPRS